MDVRKYFGMYSLTFSLCCLPMGLIYLPILLAYQGAGLLYREIARLILWYINRNNCLYVGLMEGTDVVWAMDHSLNHAIIPVLIFVDLEPAKNKGLQFLVKMKALMEQIITTKDARYWKLACLKKYSFFGLYYWELRRSLKMENLVKRMPIAAEDMTEAAVKEFAGSVATRPLPEGGRSTWELYVGQGPVAGSRLGTPLLFRFHHSVGDGPALMDFIEESLAVAPLPQPLKPAPAEPSPCSGPKELQNGCGFRGQLVTMTRQVVDIGITYLFTTETVIRQVIMTSYWKLRTPSLTGKKHLSFFFEDPPEPGKASLMDKIRRVRSRRSCRFSDVLLTAVAASLGDHFQGKPSLRPPGLLVLAVPVRAPNEPGEKTPDVKPETKEMLRKGGPLAELARLVKTARSLPEGRLNNEFTYGLPRIPLAAEGDIMGKLEQVASETAKLRDSFDHRVNQWVFYDSFSCFPTPLSKQFMFSLDGSAIVSNFPGPKKYGTIADHPMKDIVSFPPHSRACGIGLICLNYAGKINFGLMVDSAVIPDKDDLDVILNKMVNAINKMYELCTQSQPNCNKISTNY